MADAGFDPVVFRLGRGMKTRPAILRNSTKAAVTDVKQTGPDETDSVSKGPVAQLQASALKRTTCGDITNVCVNQASCVSRRRTKSTMKAPRKQPMRSKREAGAPESTNEDLLSWFLEDDGLSPVTEVVAETQSPESTGVSQSLLEESVPPQPRLFHLSVVCSLEEPVMPAVYAEDIYNYMTQREKHFALVSYMHQQPDLNIHMRAVLIDWMVEVQESCELRLETLYLAVKMVDRFLSKQLCGRDTLQLVGATCLLIAAKFEEFCPLYVDDFLYICDGSYRREEMLKMERQILQVLDFDINAPTAYHFLRHFGKCTAVGLKTLTLARYICELTLQDYSYVGEWASSVASAVLCLAIRMDSLEGQPRTLQQPAGYVRRKTHGLLGRLNQMVREQPHKKLRVIYSKYSRRLSFEVAKIPALGTVGLEELVSGEEIS
ncbi:G2/mitotic-specific cyclin-B3-like isoform X1 [Pristis pectinata]|uniref:G2/mitotic-specific cyclin-B3-like isoform X1 n=1 Tax=Pristis pectinata TaxID=685728 RepID=UPI00223DEB90|nr:G2/mitotic-specific cyclin-B3-like isoform X1 [Pristis pectinata]